MLRPLRAALAGALLLLALAPVASAAPREIWRPPLHARFQYQLQPSRDPAFRKTGGVNVDLCRPPAGGGPCVRPEVWGIDLYEPDGRTPNRRAVDAIHARGGKVLCYVDAGSIENYRPDWKAFVRWDRAHGRSLLGKPYSEQFPSEFYANLNNDRGQRDFLLKMMRRRVEKCARAGFDAVDYDVVDSWAAGRSVTGWSISYGTQLIFNKALARIGHRLGLAVALKADLKQVRDLVDHYEMAVNEECFQYRSCRYLKPFVAAGKPVFEIEYTLKPSQYCAQAERLGFNVIKQSYDLLDLPWIPCR